MDRPSLAINRSSNRGKKYQGKPYKEKKEVLCRSWGALSSTVEISSCFLVFSSRKKGIRKTLRRCFFCVGEEDGKVKGDGGGGLAGQESGRRRTVGGGAMSAEDFSDGGPHPRKL